ncbi:MAG: hypothetical protein JNM27_12195 [Leptospirales bacterium]|nr:hypothetical protein [Leptospirales bacterium]
MRSLLICLLLLTVCFPAKQTPPTGIVQTMTEDESGPVQAQVEIAGLTRQTSPAGLVALEIRREKYLANITAPGHAPMVREVDLTNVSQVSLHVFIPRLSIVQFQDPLSSQTIKLPGNAAVTIPDSLFQEAVLEPVQVEFKLLKDNEIIRGMPGSFRGTSKAGQVTAIESFGAFYMRFTSAGKTLRFAPGKKITVTMPALGQRDRIAQWTLIKETGLWKEEGLAIRRADGLYDVELGHLSWVNLDQAITEFATVWVSAKDSQGRPPGRPWAQGVNYKGYSVGTFTQDAFCLEVKAGSEALIYGQNGSVCYRGITVGTPAEQTTCKDPRNSPLIVLEQAPCNNIPAPTIPVFDSTPIERRITGPGLSEAELRKKYGRLEIIRLRDGQIFRGGIVQKGGQVSIQTSDESFTIPISAVEDVAFLPED